MYLVRRFREKSKKESKAAFIKNAHINSIDGDVFGGPLAVYAKKVVVRKVPVEIWQAIFVYCAETQDSVHASLSSSPKSPQRSISIVLSHVCRFFRNIALSMPFLWSRLDLSRPIDQFNTFIKRSSQSPLIIYHSNKNKFTLPPTHTAAFQSIQHRIVRLETPISFHDLIRLQLRNFRNLNHVVCESDWGPGEHNFKQILDGCKELKSLTWHSSFDYSTTTRFYGPAKYGLTDLSLVLQVEETFVLDFLRCCPFLERVSLQTVGYDGTEGQQMVPLPRLKSLEVSLTHYCGWLLKIQGPRIVDIFCLRSIETLYALTNPFTLPFWVVSLEIRCDVGSYFILPWLENEPGVLRKLTLSVMPMPKLQDYLSSLKWRGGTMRCAHLEELRLVYERRGRKRSEKDLLEVYSSRRRVGMKPLRIVWGDKVLHSIAVDDNTQHIAHPGSYNNNHRNCNHVRWISVERKR
ncbi:hypothetical protein CPB86DRAFT_800092 [Serendipita vermifera]|nr:hypothetical protein CPB86DRAFT_800092 [Serendipita vermifera]